VIEEEILQAMEDLKHDLQNGDKRQRLIRLLQRSETPETYKLHWKARERQAWEALALSKRVKLIDDLYEILKSYVDNRGEIHLPRVKQDLANRGDKCEMYRFFPRLIRILKGRNKVVEGIGSGVVWVRE